MKNQRIATFRDYVGELTAVYRRSSLPSATITCSGDAADFIRPFFDEIMDDHERAKIIHLSRTNGVVNVHHCSQGDEAGTVIPIKPILQQALLIKTSALILVHNHPSGNLKPSTADLQVSKKLKEACRLLELRFLDSIIVTREGHYSLADEGDL